ncbi:MAG: hypothetical protein ABWZ55_11520 [Acidimicrobiales bacterium]
MANPTPPVRVIQWCTGKIGQICIRHLAANPAFELVGVYTTSATKDGVDAGVLAGSAPLGVAATTDKAAMFALDADCVNYLPLTVDIDDMEALLRSGKNMVTAVGFTFPAVGDEAAARGDEDITIATGVIPAGTVAGMRHRWEAIVHGKPAIVFQSNWKMADGLTPDICDGTNRYIVEFHGEPSTKITLEHLEASATGDPGYPGRIWTGMSVVNLIHDVVAAPPGIRTHLDLPVGRPRGLFHDGHTWRGPLPAVG